MKRYLITFLLAGLPLIAGAFDEELEAPDVDFALQLLHGRVDLSPLGGRTSTGVSVRLAASQKDKPAGQWLWAFEGGLNYFEPGTVQDTAAVCEGACSGLPGLPPNTYKVEQDNNNKFRLSGIELGARLTDGQWFYLRGGAFLYNIKHYYQFERRYYDNVDNLLASDPARHEDETISGFSPYIGAGLNLPLMQDLKLQLESNIYRIEEETIGILNIGFQLDF